jgi:tRNA threonylcarbamoyladenosine biosynthesis protein TsaE
MKKAKSKNYPSRGTPISEKSGTYLCTDVKATYRLGQMCGEALQKGVLALFGDLGAGKTVFAKGVANALGVKNVKKEVISPTFMIIREHAGKTPFYHMDLYRVDSEDELRFLNLEDYFNRDAVTLIEWAEKGASILPAGRVEVHFDILDLVKRRIRIKGMKLKGL